MSVTAASDCVNDVELSRFIYSESGALLGHYDRCIASNEDVVYLDATPIARVKDGEIFPIEADHLGTPRVMQQPEGSVAVWSWDLLADTGSGSNAFGEQAPTGKQSFNLRFPGQYSDGNGLSYNYFRDYEAGTGRYVESDPIGLKGGFSTFGYVGGNPSGYSDRFGLLPPPGPNWFNVDHSRPQSPSGNSGGSGYGYTGSIEGFFFAGGGFTTLTCVDECGGRRYIHYIKVCPLGAAMGISGGAGAVGGVSGKNCREGTYAGWFLEGGASAGVVGGGYAQGYSSRGAPGTLGDLVPFEPNDVREGGFGLGPQEGFSFKLTFCYYIPLAN